MSVSDIAIAMVAATWTPSSCVYVCVSTARFFLGEVAQHYWPEERRVAARLVTSRLGRTSRPGDPCPNPQGAGADRPYLSLYKKISATNCTPRRETCEDRHARLPCGHAVPEV